MREGKFKRFLRRLRQNVYSRPGAYITGAVSLLLLIGLLVCLIYPQVVYADPGQSLPEDFKALRQKAINEGRDVRPESLDGFMHARVLKTIDAQVEKQAYTFGVAESKSASNFFEINGALIKAKWRCNLTLCTNMFPISLEGEGGSEILSLTVNGVKPDGSNFTDAKTGETVSAFLSLGIDETMKLTPFQTRGTLEVQELDEGEVNAMFDDMEGFCVTATNRLKPLLHSLGVDDCDLLLRSMRNVMDRLYSAVGFPAIGLFLSIPAAPLICLFFFICIDINRRDKRHRLVSQGLLEMKKRSEIEEYAPGEAIFVQEEEPQEEEPEEPPSRTTSFQRFVDGHHIRPIFGEWFFRALGLSLVVIGMVLTFLANLAFAGTLGPNWEPFASGANYYGAIQQTGYFVLVIAVIGIITETKRNLRLSSAFFFSLAAFYYLTVSAMLFLLDIAVPFDAGLGLGTGSILAEMLPGNIFLGIGLFAFIGFFLFENPPRWFINRKVFRSLSLIPALIALASVVISALYRANVIHFSFWITNLLFIRDFDSIFVGVTYEFIAFAFYASAKRKYGSNKVDEAMERPHVQFEKNAALCGLILAYTLFFYLVPSEVKAAMNIPKYTFIWALIPLFLFYKPAGKKHKNKLDILYYALYILTMLIPKALEMLPLLFL